jgi:hypothetical protein
MEKNKEYYEDLDKRSVEYKAWKKSQEVDETSQEVDTTNPFNEGVSYESFLANVTEDVTVDDLLKKHKLTKEEVSWIKEELKHLKK